MKLNQEKLQKMANQLYKKYFGTNLHCKVIYNNRLRTVAGRFFPEFNRKLNGHLYNKCLIDINPKAVKVCPKKEPKDTVKHELIHYHLWVNDYPYGHNNIFKDLAYNVLHCSVYLPWDFWYKPQSKFYVYQCSVCGNTFYQERHNNPDYVCGKRNRNVFTDSLSKACNGELNYKGTITYGQLKQPHNKFKALSKQGKKKYQRRLPLMLKLIHSLGYKDVMNFRNNISSLPKGITNLLLDKLASELINYELPKQARKQLNDVMEKEHIYSRKTAIEIERSNMQEITSCYLGIFDLTYLRKNVAPFKNELSQMENSSDKLVKVSSNFTNIKSVSIYHVLLIVRNFAIKSQKYGLKLIQDMINLVSSYVNSVKVSA